jgi:hypothetical protein
MMSLSFLSKTIIWKWLQFYQNDYLEMAAVLSKHLLVKISSNILHIFGVGKVSLILFPVLTCLTMENSIR